MIMSLLTIAHDSPVLNEEISGCENDYINSRQICYAIIRNGYFFVKSYFNLNDTTELVKILENKFSEVKFTIVRVADSTMYMKVP